MVLFALTSTVSWRKLLICCTHISSIWVERLIVYVHISYRVNSWIIIEDSYSNTNNITCQFWFVNGVLHSKHIEQYFAPTISCKIAINRSNHIWHMIWINLQNVMCKIMLCNFIATYSVICQHLNISGIAFYHGKATIDIREWMSRYLLLFWMDLIICYGLIPVRGYRCFIIIFRIIIFLICLI